MSLFKKESLELLRRRIDLPEFLSSYIPLKRSGSAFKGLCPFHEEKTPSFIVQRGDTHYHCFGCGAHGDAIDFLTNHEKMSFTEAVESLASRFNVLLEHEEGDASPAGPKKSDLKDTLEKAKQFYHFFLLNTEEGQKALPYFFSRGMDQDFIKTFELGLSPRDGHFLQKTLTAQRVPLELMELSGLVKMRAYGEM